MSSKKVFESHQQRVIRVFVSSTFRDMHQEREELVKFIFPKLRKLCEERGVTWGEVDLRWGITDEQKAEGKVLPICLAEINRCRPYFIGLLGERYGSVPHEIPQEIKEQEPWLGEHLDHSVTELEILHGVLRNPEMADHAYFYFRDPAYIKTLPMEQQTNFQEHLTEEEIKEFGEEDAERRAKERSQKLKALKEKIKKSGLLVRENYCNPKELGELVLRDLTGVVNRLFPEEEVPDPLDRETTEHEAFAESRRRVYKGRKEYFNRLNEYVKGDDPPLVVLGESGSGKSALLANWAFQHREKNPDEILIMHFIGSSPQSTDWMAMLRRLMNEFQRRCGIQQDIPEEPQELRAAFANWLHMVAAKYRVVIILDALNKLEDRDHAQDLMWLPSVIPSNIRLILSTLPGQPLDELKRRGWPSMRVEPLTKEERKQFIIEYLAHYAKEPNPEDSEQICNSPQTANPLYLKALLEEMRVYGDYDTLSKLVKHYLAASSIDKLYERILERYQKDYERDRPGLVGDSMMMLWAARRGLSEVELLEILGSHGEPFPSAYWSPFYLAAEHSFVNSSGLIGFSNDSFRQAVKNKYLASKQQQQAAHLSLADYFEKSELMNRKVDELLWQLRESLAFDRLAANLKDLKLLKAAYTENCYEVFNYFKLIKSHEDVESSELLSCVIESPQEHLEYIEIACSLLANNRFHSEALDILRSAQQFCRKTGQRARLARFLGIEYKVRKDALRLDPEGKIEKTPTAAIEEQVEIARELGMKREVVDCLEELSSLELKRNNIGRAKDLLREAKNAAKDAGHSYDHLRILTKLSALHQNLGDKLAAIHLHTLAFDIAKRENNRSAISDLCLQAGCWALEMREESADQYFANSIRFLKEVGTLEEVAGRIMTISKYYLRFELEENHKRKGYFLMREAQRLYSTMGSNKGTLPHFSEKYLAPIFFQDIVGDEQDPLPADFLMDKISWPLPPLELKADLPGKRCTWWMTSRGAVETCRQSTQSCSKVLARGESAIEKLDVEFAWDAIFYMLSKFRRTPPQQRPSVPDTPYINFHIAMFGNWELNDAFNPGGQIYQYVKEDEVGVIYKSLVYAREDQKQFAANYNGRDMDNLNVYPGGWEEMGLTGKEYVTKQFLKLIAFYSRALKQRACVICGIWSPEGTDSL